MFSDTCKRCEDNVSIVKCKCVQFLNQSVNVVKRQHSIHCKTLIKNKTISLKKNYL